jgi:MoaA/NifB/PqqE/SkfB family radical SAM enzyme
VLACEKVQVLGGEPLLHSALLDLLRLVVQSGIGKQVAVKTNGLLLHRAPSDFWRLTDTVIVSVYPATERFLTRKRELLEATASRHGTKLIYRPIKQFQEIHRDHGEVDPEVTSAIFAACEYKQYLFHPGPSH